MNAPAPVIMESVATSGNTLSFFSFHENEAPIVA